MGREKDRSWTLMAAVQWTAGYLENKGIDSPRLTAELLMSHCLEQDRLTLYLDHDRPLNTDELAAYRRLIQRRVRREPVAYITGTRGFWDVDLAVSPEVLIPRPDTETLVAETLDLLDQAAERLHRPVRVLELGSGSGAVIVALAHARPGCYCAAVDLSPAAARITLENARRNGCLPLPDMLAGSWFSAFGSRARFDLIVSNPPYIPTQDIDTLAPEIRNHEPRSALDGGPDGLSSIRRILNDAASYLNTGGHLLLEVGFDQSRAVTALARAIPAFEKTRRIRDDAGHHRVVVMKKKIEPENQF